MREKSLFKLGHRVKTVWLSAQVQINSFKAPVCNRGILRELHSLAGCLGSAESIMFSRPGNMPLLALELSVRTLLSYDNDHTFQTHQRIILLAVPLKKSPAESTRFEQSVR